MALQSQQSLCPPCTPFASAKANEALAAFAEELQLAKATQRPWHISTPPAIVHACTVAIRLCSAQ